MYHLILVLGSLRVDCEVFSSTTRLLEATGKWCHAQVQCYTFGCPFFADYRLAKYVHCSQFSLVKVWLYNQGLFVARFFVVILKYDV